MSRTKGVVGSLALAMGLFVATAQEPDNTKVNQQPQPTADKAKNTKSDLQLMRQIRREIVKDKSLSTYAHNVKVIADHGKVTLKGPVHSDDEKKAVEEIARKYARDGNVTNDLEVKGDTQK